MKYYLKQIGAFEGAPAIIQLDENAKVKRVVGRLTCPCLIDAGSISRKHALFKKIDSHWHVKDLNSKNGTFINGTKIETEEFHPLEVGCIIDFGKNHSRHRNRELSFMLLENDSELSEEVVLDRSDESSKQFPDVNKHKADNVRLPKINNNAATSDSDNDADHCNNKTDDRTDFKNKLALETDDRTDFKNNLALERSRFYSNEQQMFDTGANDERCKSKSLISNESVNVSNRNSEGETASKELKDEVEESDSSIICINVKEPEKSFGSKHLNNKPQIKRLEHLTSCSLQKKLDSKIKFIKSFPLIEPHSTSETSTSETIKTNTDNEMEGNRCSELSKNTSSTKKFCSNRFYENGEKSLLLPCCKINIGIVELSPLDDEKNLVINFRNKGFSFEYPVSKADMLISVAVSPQDIQNVESFADTSILFIFITSNCATRIQNILSIDSSQISKFFPKDKEVIVFRFGNISDDDKHSLVDFFTKNEIKTETIHIQRVLSILDGIANQKMLNSDDQPTRPVVTLLTYPSPPLDGIDITSKDIFCLNSGEYLNDVIIDFYLKYLFHDKLSENSRNRTHIFSSFFYSRLMQEANKLMLMEEEADSKRLILSCHDQVKTWTKNLDIFSKDFIIIPINLYSHWFLAIICFPGKLFEKPDCLTVIEKLSNNNTKDFTGNQRKTTFPIRNRKCKDDRTVTIVLEKNSNHEIEDCLSEESETEMEEMYQLKEMPCICIFDSLRGPCKGEVLAPLRQYLEVEWKVKKGNTRAFDRSTMPGFIMRCPQQTNSSDCGVYVLHYVEKFFESPLKYYGKPMPDLSDWFTEEDITEKRESIKAIISNLRQKQNTRNIPVATCSRKHKAIQSTNNSSASEPKRTRSSINR